MSDTIDVLILAGRFEVRGSTTQTLNIAEHMPRMASPKDEVQEPKAEPVAGTKESRKKQPSGPAKVRVVCLDDNRLACHQRDAINSEDIAPLAWPLIGTIARRYLLSSIFDSPPDVIHVQGLRMHSVGRWLARKLNRPYVITMHHVLTNRDRLRIDPRTCAKIVATSDEIRESVIANARVPNSMVALIRNGVVTPSDAGTREILGHSHRAVIGTAGPLEAGQGLSRFIRAIPRILAEGPAPLAGGSLSPEFLIAGAGPDERHLRELARDLGVQSKTTFVSNLYDFSESLSAMDVFCLPVERAGMGVTMLQAMACGVPVIATDVGDVSQVITDGITGLIIPPADEDAIVKAVSSLLKDVGRARRIGQAGASLIRDRYPLNNMLSDMLNVYREAKAAGTSLG